MTTDREEPHLLRAIVCLCVEKRHWTVEDHLEGQARSSTELYHRFVEMLGECGPFTYAVSKSSITFKGERRGFAGVRPTRGGLTGYLDLQRVVDDPRFISSSPYESRLYVHQMRLTAPGQLDETLMGWLREAYAVGQGAHLLRDRSTPPA